MEVSLTSQWHINEMWGMDKLYNYLNNIGGSKSNTFSEIKQYLAEKKENAVTKTEFEFPLQEANGTPQAPKKIQYAVIPIKGVMTTEDSWCDYGALSIASMLQEAYNDTSISEIILEVNSGGGESMAGYIIQNAVNDRNKPVKAYCHMVGSAAYNAVCSCDGIYLSNPASEAGSVGSYYSINKQAVKWYKETFDEIYAKQSTEKNDAIRAYFAGNKQPLFDKATEGAQTFIDTVHKYRPQVSAKIDKGKMFNANEALENGLVDGILTNINSVVMQPVIDNTNFKNVQMERFYAALNRIFGWTLNASTTDADTLLGKLDAIPSLTDSINEAVTAKFSAMQESVTEITAKFNAASEQVTNLSDSIATMQAQLSALTDENTLLKSGKTSVEAELIAVKKEKELLLKEGNPTPTLDVVEKLLENITPTNDSKY